LHDHNATHAQTVDCAVIVVRPGCREQNDLGAARKVGDVRWCPRRSKCYVVRCAGDVVERDAGAGSDGNLGRIELITGDQANRSRAWYARRRRRSVTPSVRAVTAAIRSCCTGTATAN